MTRVTPALEAQGIRKTFSEGREVVEVLTSVDLVLQAGEVTVLEGPSGSGKSTLLSILGCMLTATAGRLVVGGVAIDQGTDLARVRRDHLGFVFQQFNLVGALTALDNVAYPLRLRGVSAKRAREEAMRSLDGVGLADRAKFLPRELSGGQKQRVAIARALIGKPQVLLADEPTANLDARVGERVLTTFATIAREAGGALLIVTHDPKVRAYGDRVLRLEGGQVSQVA